ncbi:ModE molybdate transport repressor domain-containing protein [Mesorhizobium albiziae]|uniref:ModE molybdate transport repressor domain-containing protein n=1 Tax=Neomesorhizobium albiziae TaxID=335020 RepID=A0A1I4C6V6_9HYPH|nr:LysR family transcriptional regulator [Mesorhizobium albiziae]GLS29446.1 LysR family transcriptional regulator [Mesorhizobium albiziae]SFK76685.1 ModE molybdate transport repressor domain-containing protein [Mesorhizobium albiziae]
MRTTLDWDDLRYALAVAEGGSLAAGAKKLGVSHTTAMRRIAAFEERLGMRLFERLPGGYELTAGGEELIETARGIGVAVTGLERRLAGSDLKISGTVRVTTADTLAASLLPGILAALKSAHPGIGVDLVVSNLFLNLTKREADIAIRPADDPPPGLFGRRLCSIGFAVYGAAMLGIEPQATAEALGGYPWIAPDDSLSMTAVGRWMPTALPEIEIAIQADSLVSACRLAEAGIGLAILPCYLGDGSPALRRLTPPLEAVRTGLWILTHEDLRRTARIRAFMEFVGNELQSQRRLIEGAIDGSRPVE